MKCSPAPPATADPATLVGRTAAALAAATLVAAEIYHAADVNLRFALTNLNIFSLDQTTVALNLGRALLVALLSLLTRDSVRGLMAR